MANLIQIKRSLTTAAPTSLANGELAYTANGDHLFIGSNGAVVHIGGIYNYGVLTANQALVANSTSGIDKVIVANLVPTSVYANGSFGANGEVLTSNGSTVHWAVPVTTIDGLSDVTITSPANNQLIVYDAAAGQWENHNISGNTNQVDVLFANQNIQVTLSDTLAIPTSITVATGNVVTNAAGVWVAGVVNASTLSVGSNFVANATVVDITVPTAFDANVVIGDSGTDVVSIIASVNTNIMPSANITYNLGNTAMRWNEVYAANVHAQYGYFEGSVQVIGDLTVSGNVTTVNVSSLQVTDPLIYLAGNNYTSDLLDIGFVGNYYDGAFQRHAGLIRHAADDEFYLFKNYKTEPSDNVIHVTNAASDFTIAMLNTYLTSGGLTSTSNSVTITANSTVNVNITANTLTLSTPLVATSGGTGYASFTTGDVLVASNSTHLSKLTLGADGTVLQSNGTTVVYATLDGGTF